MICQLQQVQSPGGVTTWEGCFRHSQTIGRFRASLILSTTSIPFRDYEVLQLVSSFYRHVVRPENIGTLCVLLRQQFPVVPEAMLTDTDRAGPPNSPEVLDIVEHVRRTE